MSNNWLDRTAYPFTPNYFDVNSHKLHYIEEGKGEILLFVHGTPSWSFDFRHVIKELSTNYRCIAIDHIGFGLSDKPERYDYSTQNHSKTLEKFLLEKDLKNVTMIVHDFGGPIGLNVAINHAENISRIIVLNSWMWSSKNDPEFITMSKVLKSPLLPFLYRYLNFSPRFILPASFGDNKISRKTLKQYTKPFENKTQRNGPLAFARSLLNDQDWFEQLWAKKQAIMAKPTLFIWGMKDPVIKPHYLDKFQTWFTNSQAIQLDTCGHFPQEEQPTEVLRSMLAFLSQNTGKG